MNSIRLQCPNDKCRTVLSVSARLAGRKVRCSCCGRTFKLPNVTSRSRARRRGHAA